VTEKRSGTAQKAARVGKATSTQAPAKKTAAKTSKVGKARNPASVRTSGKAKAPTLLSGGNPQIVKGDGDGPVQTYISAMPGWKHQVGLQLDALIVRAVPGVRKAVKWNSPFYGVEGQGWFLSLHCFNRYIKVAFFRGTSLLPLPPGASKNEEVRYLDIYETAELDQKLMVSWIKQASKLPGWVP